MKLRPDVTNNCLINSLLLHSMCKTVIDLISVAVFPQFVILPLKHVLKEELISLSLSLSLFFGYDIPCFLVSGKVRALNKSLLGK